MEQMQPFILSMAKQAISDWADGKVPYMFPITSETKENPGNMIWFGIINAMAYGFEHGMAYGHQMEASAVGSEKEAIHE